MVSPTCRLITTAFPAPSGSIRRALELLDVVARGDAEEMSTYGNLNDLPRPWEPATCPTELRETIWTWVDQVVAWLNREYAWKTVDMIPECWPLHPHIARELPVLAVLRWHAEESVEPAAMEDWNRYTFPMFSDRLAQRLGQSACRTSEHATWPGESRYERYISPESFHAREAAIMADVRPPTPFPAVRSQNQ